MRTVFASLLGLLLFTCPDLVGTQLWAQQDLKVGLVLSGGGAKGYAHIGALRVIEEAGIEIDYIGGTSMGAIVGGLYAAGYSADQLEQLLRSVDIMAEIQDAVAREDRTIYEKLYDEKYLLSISMQDFGIQLPTALSDGQRVHDLFAHWTARVGHVNNFRDLPIPYLAVATDLETGDDVVIEHGMLAEAMRASAALPGVLSPYLMNDRLLTDGGVSNNYPAEEIKAKGMDYILGISVESDPLKAQDIASVADLLMQIAFFQANRRNVEQYEVTDLDIKPDLTGFSVLSFGDIDTLINAGYRAALAMKPALDSLAALQNRPGTTRDTTDAPIPQYLNVRSVRIEGSEELSDRQVLSYFDEQLPGRISWEDFRDGLSQLHVTGRFRNIDYNWSYTGGPDEEVDLALRFTPLPAFGQEVRLGLHYDQVYRANLLVNLTLYDQLIDNTVTSLDVIAGERLRYRFDFRANRVNGSALGLRSRLDYADVGFDVPETVSDQLGVVFDQLDYRFSDLNAELYWDLRQTQNSFTGIASGFKYYSTDSDQLASADTASLFALRNDFYFVAKAYFLYDKLSKTHFPLQGFKLDFETRGIRDLAGRSPGVALNVDVKFLGVLPLGDHSGLGLEANVGGFLNESVLPYRYYLGSNNRELLNNFRPFPSLDLGEASGSNLLLAEIFYRRRLFANHYLHLGGRGARIGNPEQLPSSLDRNWVAAGVLGYGIDSPLGPIELTYGYGTAGGALYFNLGHWF